MTDDRCVALLRGINVGGHNRVAMADLRGALDAAGLQAVRTYIQTGNILFDAPPGRGEQAIAESIRAVLDRELGLTVPVVVRWLDDIERIASAHPDADGDIPAKWLHVFLLDRHTAGPAVRDPERFEPDRFVVDGKEIYVTYPDGAARSKLTIDVFERSFDVTATARNLSTLAKIVEIGRGH